MAKTSERAAAAWCVRLLCVLVVLAALLEAAAARGSFQKIPFNGSMFGKRAAATEYELGHALSAMCEAAAATCTAWTQPDK